MNCKVIFKRNENGDVEMYRQVNFKITQEGNNIDNTTIECMRRLYRSLECLTSDMQLVLDCSLIENPTRQVNDE